MTENSDWKRLIEALDEWTGARQSAPDRIVVLVPDGEGFRQVTIVMTEDEWDDIVGPMWGSVGEAIEAVKRTLMTMEPQHTHAVYGQYNLVPSTKGLQGLR